MCLGSAQFLTSHRTLVGLLNCSEAAKKIFAHSTGSVSNATANSPLAEDTCPSTTSTQTSDVMYRDWTLGGTFLSRSSTHNFPKTDTSLDDGRANITRPNGAEVTVTTTDPQRRHQEVWASYRDAPECDAVDVMLEDLMPSGKGLGSLRKRAGWEEPPVGKGNKVEPEGSCPARSSSPALPSRLAHLSI